jgi:hypothetical protein
MALSRKAQSFAAQHTAALHEPDPVGGNARLHRPAANERSAVLADSESGEDVIEFLVYQRQVLDDVLGEQHRSTWEWRERGKTRLRHRIVKAPQILGGLSHHVKQRIQGSVNDFGGRWFFHP